MILCMRVLKFNYNGSERNYFACPINFSCYIRLGIFKTIILRKNRKCTDIVNHTLLSLCHCSLLAGTETSTYFLLSSSKQCKRAM